VRENLSGETSIHRVSGLMFVVIILYFVALPKEALHTKIALRNTA